MKQLVICTHKREKKIKVNNILFITYVSYLVYILKQFLTVPHVSKWNTISIITWLAIFHNIYTELAGYFQIFITSSYFKHAVITGTCILMMMLLVIWFNVHLCSPLMSFDGIVYSLALN